MTRKLAYCTNVHAGSDLEELTGNLDHFALPVKQRFSPQQPMGIGLWIAAPAAAKLLQPTRLAELTEWLAEHQLLPFTLNGFPYGDFHEPVVKHRVYHPTWFKPDRLDYTLNLVDILHALLPAGVDGSISTLPIAWRQPAPTPEQWSMVAQQLGRLAERLAQLEDQTGRRITVCLEPEPGCLLQRSSDVVTFFADHLCPDRRAEQRKRYIQVCHDICHAAVMFEDQQDVLSRYAEHDIGVGKIQVSSAVQADFDAVEPSRRTELVDALSSFAEDRYLHQTAICQEPGEPIRFFDDLPAALTAAREDSQLLRGRWRVHFHVPIYLEQFHPLGATRDEILRCLSAVKPQAKVHHFEVETYAWGVLPQELREGELADGIAREMSWLREQL